jgi:hypothetical protein
MITTEIRSISLKEAKIMQNGFRFASISHGAKAKIKAKEGHPNHCHVKF